MREHVAMHLVVLLVLSCAVLLHAKVVSECGGWFDCHGCVQNANCSWCASQGQCVEVNSSGCLFHEWKHCCNTYTTCETCAASVARNESCGWCPSQGCYKGRPSGPDGFNCTSWGFAICASPTVLSNFSWSQLLLGISIAVLALVSVIGVVAAAIYMRHEMSKEAARSAYNARVLSLRKRTNCQNCRNNFAEYFCEGCVRKLCDSCRLLLHTRGSLRSDHTPVPLLPEGGGADAYASLAPLIAASGTAGGRLRSFAVEYGSNSAGKGPGGEHSPELMESISPSSRRHRLVRSEDRSKSDKAETDTEETGTTPLITSHEVAAGGLLTTPGNSVALPTLAIPLSSSEGGFDHSPPDEGFSPPPPFIASKALKDVVE